MQYYDIDGLPITFEQWWVLFNEDTSRIVALDELRNDNGDIVVLSTVLVGLATTMFETAMWSNLFPIEIVEKYQTFDDAYTGHWTRLSHLYVEYPFIAKQTRHQRITDKYFGNEKNKVIIIDT